MFVDGCDCVSRRSHRIIVPISSTSFRVPLCAPLGYPPIPPATLMHNSPSLHHHNTYTTTSTHSNTCTSTLCVYNPTRCWVDEGVASSNLTSTLTHTVHIKYTTHTQRLHHRHCNVYSTSTERIRMLRNFYLIFVLVLMFFP